MLERLPLAVLRDVDVDVKQKFQFGGIGALINDEIDMLVTPDPLPRSTVHFEAACLRAGFGGQAPASPGGTGSDHAGAVGRRNADHLMFSAAPLLPCFFL
ncbi:hypothetical protein [Janthinobacterium sp. LB2P10]|jgi:hypothetical protein|uniref:hypothetical protein n=1 Tax=Janthinobacterium sp. LB2P10 TaxID=3424194 RepID=UPI00031B6606